MANHKSALKKARTDEKRRLRNRNHRAKLRTALKGLRAAVDAGDAEGARNLLQPTLSLIDHSATHGVIHANAAARTKSRLQRAVNALQRAD
jgi:small subunit ribosomal protein S20